MNTIYKIIQRIEDYVWSLRYTHHPRRWLLLPFVQYSPKKFPNVPPLGYRSRLSNYCLRDY
jgi:hypothetical protein